MDTHSQTHQNGKGPLAQTEVMTRPKRRRFSAAYKRSILDEADRCTEPGAVGALLRREGLYCSNLTRWRRQRERGELAGAKRGRKPVSDEAKELKRLERENQRLKRKLEQAETNIEVQKKLSQLLGLTETKPGGPR
jgi:transposase-like protein